jgi:hypothetical protein
MADKITEPADINPGTQDWQDLLTKVEKINGGIAIIGFANPTDMSSLVIAEGSRVEVNGSYYQCTANENVDLSVVSTISAFPAVFYIYAEPQTNGTLIFKLETLAPTLQPAKGGLFHSNNNWRCIAHVRKVSSSSAYSNLTMCLPYAYIETRDTNPLHLDANGKLSFSLSLSPTDTPQDGDMWLEEWT